MPRLYIDIETYSRANLLKLGVYPYAAHPSFRVLMAAWALDDGPVQLTYDVADLAGMLSDPDYVKVAHNAQFERVCLGMLPPEQWHDTMAIAAELGLPRSLKHLAARLGGEQKDDAGSRLIKLFCVPNRKGTRNMPEDHPEDWEAFGRYCMQDVETLRSIDRTLGDWPTEEERRVWVADQYINDRGVSVDLDLARAAVAAAEDNRIKQELEASALTGVTNPGSTQQLLAWFEATGHALPDLKAETVRQALADAEEPHRRVLELRQDLALTASKKYVAVANGTGNDGRLRGQFRFFGAHTGRWSGVGVQLHNLPRHGFKEDVDAEAAIVDLKLGLGADSDTLKRLVRSVILGPLTVFDYAAIEARVVAWLAGEEWALQAFRDGRDIYVETAERMGGLTRFQGKVAVLALGYNGGVSSLRAMGAEGNDAELKRLVYQWRGANPAIVDLWARMGVAFEKGGNVGQRMRVEVDGSDRYIRLPSGRALVYRKCAWKFEETNTGPRKQASFWGPDGYRTRTYGGRLVENVTQAVARDILAAALVRLEDRGYRTVGHVHDEVLVEGTDLDGVTEAVLTPPSWADGLPIDGEGFVCRRYRKG